MTFSQFRLLMQWIDKLPDYDPHWPDRAQRAWLNAYMFILRTIEMMWRRDDERECSVLQMRDTAIKRGEAI